MLINAEAVIPKKAQRYIKPATQGWPMASKAREMAVSP